MKLFPALPACLAILTLGACVGTPKLPVAPVAAAERPHFDALAFFAGRTEGKGRLTKILSGTTDTLVEGRGTVNDGTLTLEQDVHEGSRPVKHRTWHIRETAPDRYTGALTDAEGKVSGETIGNRLHLSFTMKGGLPTEQWLTLAPDGSHAMNRMTVKKFGMTVAVLEEDIRRIE